MCVTIRVVYSCGCYGRTLGKEKCRWYLDSHTIAAEGLPEGFKENSLLFQLYRGYCKSEEEQKGVKGVLVHRKCSKCSVKGDGKAEEAGKVYSQRGEIDLALHLKEGSKRRLSKIPEDRSE